jgi:hypothetical protein
MIDMDPATTWGSRSRSFDLPPHELAYVVMSTVTMHAWPILHCCMHAFSLTRCGSTHALEYYSIAPNAMMGTNNTQHVSCCCC